MIFIALLWSSGLALEAPRDRLQLFTIFHVFCSIDLITGSTYQLADNQLIETMELLTVIQPSGMEWSCF